MHKKTEKVLEKSRKINRTLTGKPTENVDVSSTGKNVNSHHVNAEPVHNLDVTRLGL